MFCNDRRVTIMALSICAEWCCYLNLWYPRFGKRKTFLALSFYCCHLAPYSLLLWLHIHNSEAQPFIGIINICCEYTKQFSSSVQSRNWVSLGHIPGTSPALCLFCCPERTHIPLWMNRTVLAVVTLSVLAEGFRARFSAWHWAITFEVLKALFFWDVSGHRSRVNWTSKSWTSPWLQASAATYVRSASSGILHSVEW
jgi:hypothetical protein